MAVAIRDYALESESEMCVEPPLKLCSKVLWTFTDIEHFTFRLGFHTVWQIKLS